jgi:hypothetical protein
VSFLDDPVGVAHVVIKPSLLKLEGELTFCEGFAQGAGDAHYAWEIWTRPEWDAAVAYRTPIPEPIARLPLLGPDAPPVDVFERPERPDFVWTQLVVPGPTFTPALLERIRTGSDEERALCFTEVPPDDDST